MNFQNPYLNPYMMPQVQQVQTQVIRVNGENGAKAYSIGANSSALLLDESGLMVWLVTSDGAGYKTVSAYDITPHQSAPAPDFASLENRIKRLEERINDATDSPAVRRSQDFSSSERHDKHDQVSRKPTNAPQSDYADESSSGSDYGDRQAIRRRCE